MTVIGVVKGNGEGNGEEDGGAKVDDLCVTRIFLNNLKTLAL